MSTTDVNRTVAPNPTTAEPKKDWNWQSLFDRDAKGLDGFDLGKIKSVAEEYVYLEKGTFTKEKFFIPKRFADRFDGKTLWFSVTKAQAEGEFKRDAPLSSEEYR